MSRSFSSYVPEKSHKFHDSCLFISVVKWYEKIRGLQENLVYVHSLVSEVKRTKSALWCIVDFKEDLFKLSQIRGLFPQENHKIWGCYHSGFCLFWFWFWFDFDLDLDLDFGGIKFRTIWISIGLKVLHIGLRICNKLNGPHWMHWSWQPDKKTKICQNLHSSTVLQMF